MPEALSAAVRARSFGGDGYGDTNGGGDERADDPGGQKCEESGGIVIGHTIVIGTNRARR